MSLFISNISKHRAALITPIVVLSIAIILMIVAFSAADWNGEMSKVTMLINVYTYKDAPDLGNN